MCLITVWGRCTPHFLIFSVLQSLAYSWIFEGVQRLFAGLSWSVCEETYMDHTWMHAETHAAQTPCKAPLTGSDPFIPHHRSIPAAVVMLVMLAETDG